MSDDFVRFVLAAAVRVVLTSDALPATFSDHRSLFCVHEIYLYLKSLPWECSLSIVVYRDVDNSDEQWQ